MRNHVFITTLMSVMVIFTGCKDDLLEENKPAYSGDEVIFGASGKFETVDATGGKSRTSYGDVSSDGKSQTINWVNGDRIMIYSPEVQNVSSYVEYEVTSAGNEQGTLAKVNADQAGLQWGSVETHNFYGVYPSVEQSGLDKKYYSFEGTILNGYVPVTQAHDLTQQSDGNWTAKCNMNYAQMVAKTTIKKSDGGNGVDLSFYPIVTAMDLELTASADVRSNAVNIIAQDDEPIAGRYKTDLSTINPDNGKFAPDCDLTNDPIVNLSYITVPLYSESNGVMTPIWLRAGKTIKLTVFMLPHTDLDNITVRISHVNAKAKSCDLINKGVSIKFTPHKKTIINMTLPAWNGQVDNVNNWFSGLENNVLISQLSIPGTANSYSSALSDASQKTQTASITDQWNAGIRYFELRSPNSSTGDLKDAGLQCNRQSLNITFGDAVTQLLNLLKNNPTEFLMIAPAFESDQGRGDYVEDYLNDLNNFYTQTLPTLISDRTPLHLEVYSPTMTVGDLRGGVMFMARITSEEDSEEFIDQLERIGIKEGLAINQWGSLKDYWGRRGYTINGTKAHNWSQSYSSTDVEYYLLNGNTTVVDGGTWADPIGEHLTGNTSFSPNELLVVPNKQMGETSTFKTIVDYKHTSFRKGGDTGEVFLQEWSRVVPKDAAGNYYLYRKYNYDWDTTWNLYWCYWGESYTEKQSDIWNTFLLCQEENTGKVGSRFFINSLDGYYVDRNISESYWPYIENKDSRPNEEGGFGTGGSKGNIENYAKDINAWFYGKLLEVGFENITGPLNIVILDRVLDGSDGGNYLPQVIIDNNFKFPLMTGTNGGNTIPADASYTSGGNVIE